MTACWPPGVAGHVFDAQLEELGDVGEAEIQAELEMQLETARELEWWEL